MTLNVTVSNWNQDQSEDERSCGDDADAEHQGEDGVVLYVLRALDAWVVLGNDGGGCPGDNQVWSQDVS